MVIFEILSRKNVRIKFTIDAFFYSLPRVLKLLFFELLYLIICGIVATKFLKGKLY